MIEATQIQCRGDDRLDLAASIEGWITVEQGRALLKMAGQAFDALKQRAATREFTPVTLGVTASMAARPREAPAPGRRSSPIWIR